MKLATAIRQLHPIAKMIDTAGNKRVLRVVQYQDGVSWDVLVMTQGYRGHQDIAAILTHWDSTVMPVKLIEDIREYDATKTSSRTICRHLGIGK